MVDTPDTSGSATVATVNKHRQTYISNANLKYEWWTRQTQVAAQLWPPSINIHKHIRVEQTWSCGNALNGHNRWCVIAMPLG